MKEITASKWGEPTIERASERFMGCFLLPEHSIDKDQQRGIESKGKSILRRFHSGKTKWEIVIIIIITAF